MPLPRLANHTPNAPTHAGFLPFRILVERPLLWIGFAALLGWTDLLLCFEGALRDAVTEQGGLVHDPLFLSATLAAGCVLLVAGGMSSSRLRDTLASHGAVGTAALAGALGSGAAVALTAAAASVVPGLPYALGALVGACVAACTLAWGGLLADLDLRAALLVVSVAACLQWMILALTTNAGLIPRLAIAVVLPLIAGGVAIAEHSRTPDARHPAASAPPSAGAGPDSRVSASLVRLASALLIFSLVVQFVWCFFIKMLPGRLEPTLFPLVFGSVALLAALATGLCAAMMEHQGRYRLELYYRLAFLLCLGGVGATGVAAADLTPIELFASYTTVYGGYSLLGPTMWMLTLGYAFMRSTPVRRVVGLVFGGQYLGFFAGFALIAALERTTFAGAGQTLGPLVVLLGICALGVAYTALFPERSLLALSPRLFGLSPASIEERCARVAQQYGLTPRESEVLALLARGRDVGFICDELGIARNTVNVHRKGIYAKLGIHSQQELLSTVEAISEP